MLHCEPEPIQWRVGSERSVAKPTTDNEVVGPFGPGTVFQQWSPSLRMIRASAWVKSTRVGQLLGEAIGHFRVNQDAQGYWRGMEMFSNKSVPADDPRLAAVYANYRQNLVDICRMATRAGAKVVLSTVAANLRDWRSRVLRARPPDI